MYLMSDGAGLHKIGLSTDPKQRARELRAELVGVSFAENMLWLERYLHVAYSEFRQVGEWFDLNPECVAEVLSLPEEVRGEQDIPTQIITRHQLSLKSIEEQRARRAFISVRLPGPMVESLDAFIARLPYPVRRTAVLLKALENFLREQGHYPPSPRTRPG